VRPPSPEDGPAPARIRPYLSHSGLGPAAEAAPSGLRPFVLTSGRVDGVDPNLAPELRTILALCAEPVSVAEISARARLHLGVTRILVGDLRAAGYLDVHARDTARPYDPETIMRVIRGLRAIS
jgi:hypothetical protein